MSAADSLNMIYPDMKIVVDGYEDFLMEYSMLRGDDLEGVLKVSKLASAWADYLSELESAIKLGIIECNLQYATILATKNETDKEALNIMDKKISLMIYQRRIKAQIKKCISIYFELSKTNKRNIKSMMTRSY